MIKIALFEVELMTNFGFILKIQTPNSKLTNNQGDDDVLTFVVDYAFTIGLLCKESLSIICSCAN